LLQHKSQQMHASLYIVMETVWQNVYLYFIQTNRINTKTNWFTMTQWLCVVVCSHNVTPHRIS